MDYRKLGDADLADFCRNVTAQLTAHAVTALETEAADALLAELTPLQTAFEAATIAAVQQTAEKLSKTAIKASQRETLLKKLAKVRNQLVAVEADRADFELCGYTYQSLPASVVAATPTGLSATGTSNGVNTLKFTGNNRTGTVTYEIWRLAGDTEPFRLIGTTKKQTYIDTPVTPGEVYNYKVRAVAATNVSAFSNVAVVYGSGGR